MSTLTPYEILQLPENSTFYSIKARYRVLVRILHPDKHTARSGNDYVDGLSTEEKDAMFLAIQKAYETLRHLKGREDDMPSEDIKYNIGREYENHISEEFKQMGITENFNEDKFNEEFNNYNEKIKSTDPFNVGYNEFSVNETSTSYNTSSLDKDSELMYKKKREKPKVEEKLIERPDYLSQTSFGSTFEFGLSKITDFSTKLGSKNGINAMDLQSAYNNPYFESIQSDSDISMDKKSFDEAMNERMNERTQLNGKIESKEIYLSEDQELEKVIQLNKDYEKSRILQEQRDQHRVHRKIKDNQLPTRS
jgi:curved DNA-binding protein CbpA